MEAPRARRLIRRLRTARLRDVPEGLVVLLVAARIEHSLRRHQLTDTARIAHVGLSDDPAPAGDDEREAVAGVLPPWALRRAYLVSLIMRGWPFGDTCLRRALVTGHRLSALSPVLVLGVRSPSQEGPLAHAWLRIDGIEMDVLSQEFTELTIPS